MFSINQLSISAQDFQDSKGSNKQSLRKGMMNMSIFDNQSNSRQLFRKCKQIIQQQMIQISQLSSANEKIALQLEKSQQQNENKSQQIQKLQAEYQQARQKNELLHKELSKQNKVIDDLNKQILNKDNIIKLKENKIEMLTQSLNKIGSERDNLYEKCHVLQETVQLLKRQMQKAQSLIQQKDTEMRMEIEQLKRVKSLLERNGKVQRIDQMLEWKGAKSFTIPQTSYIGWNENVQRNKNLCRPFYTVEESPFHNVDINNANCNHSKSKASQKYSESFGQKGNFHSVQLTRERNLNKVKNMETFSIINETRNTSPVSRIRKNISKSRNKHELQAHKPNHSLSANQPKYHQSTKQSSQKDTSFQSRSPLSNPEASQQLSNIKKQILQQYGKMEIKKGKISHDRINQTLMQIENKLEKMVRISAVDDSESEFQ